MGRAELARIPTAGPQTNLSATALQTFSRIADLWGLSVPQRRVLLGAIPESTYFRYMKAPGRARLSHDTLERASHILGIFKALNVLFPKTEAADAWIKRPNDAALFKGRSALDYMLSGAFTDLVAVRAYLDAQRGW
jgi:uncharacterized protein (DUF2384 family)